MCGPIPACGESNKPNRVHHGLSNTQMRIKYSHCRERSRTDDALQNEEEKKSVVVVRKVYGRRKRKESNKSLLGLGFEELKGFMDLGFVFNADCSWVVEIGKER